MKKDVQFDGIYQIFKYDNNYFIDNYNAPNKIGNRLKFRMRIQCRLMDAKSLQFNSSHSFPSPL